MNPDPITLTETEARGWVQSMINAAAIDARANEPDWRILDLLADTPQWRAKFPPAWKKSIVAGIAGTAKITTCNTSGTTTTAHGMWVTRSGGHAFATDDGSSWSPRFVTHFTPDDATTMRAKLDAVRKLADEWHDTAIRACPVDHGGSCADCAGRHYAREIREVLAD